MTVITRCAGWAIAIALPAWAAGLVHAAEAQEVRTFEEQFEQSFREGSQGANWPSLQSAPGVPSGEEAEGPRVDNRSRSQGTDPGSRLLMDVANGIITGLIGQPVDVRSGAPDRNRGRLRIPAGHYPPPGSCRVWFVDRPPGQQPPPGGCNVRVPRGAVLVRG